jgi:uncharacterized paraquat-inducible protein A
MENQPKPDVSGNAPASPHSKLHIQELAQVTKQHLANLVAPTRMETAAAAAGRPICKTCNAMIRADANYCQTCGAKVTPGP